MARGKIVLTYQDYLQMPDDRTRREILGGDLFVTPAPSPRHQEAVGSLYTVLRTHAASRRLGKVYVSPIDVVLSQHDVVQPDVIFIRGDRLAIVGEAAIQGPPDLIVEVLSPSTTPLDRRRKKEAYARFGVQEYWIVDPDAGAVEVHELQEHTYVLADRAEGDAPVRSILFPDLVLVVRDLWD